MRIGYFQFRPIFGKVSQNVLKVTSALGKAEADLIVLPELPFTGYYFRDRSEIMALAEDPDDSPTIECLRALCREKRMYIATGFTEKRRDKCFNSAVLVGPEGVIYVYRKMHAFLHEKEWFDPGDTAPQTFLVRDARVGMMVCYDWAFPEVARMFALRGGEILCHPSNLVLAHCQGAMLTRCLENCIFAVTANRYGADKRPHGELKFTGKSQIVAPGGVLLHRGPPQGEELFVTEVNPAEARDKHVTKLNDLLADRRPEMYADLTAK